jgi:hypothetical protein
MFDVHNLGVSPYVEVINLGGNDDPLGPRVACYIGGKAPRWRVHVGHVDVLEYYSIQYTCQGLITSNNPP